MSYEIDANLKFNVLSFLKDVTDGIIRVALYDDTDTIVDTYKTIAWNVPVGDAMTMSTSEIEFSVSASTTLGYIVFYFYDGASDYDEAITYTFETTYEYVNQGIFTLTAATITM